MCNDDLPFDLHWLHARLGLEAPVSQIIECFEKRGEAFANRPRSNVTAEFEMLTSFASREPGSRLPVIHMRAGRVQFALAAWGSPIGSGKVRLFRTAERRAIGVPGLIPASHIDVKAEDPSRLLRITSAAGLIFIGCAVVPDQFGHAAYVTPLIRDAGPHLKPYLNSELLIVRIAPCPEPGNFTFIMREDNGWLQRAENPRLQVKILGGDSGDRALIDLSRVA